MVDPRTLSMTPSGDDDDSAPAPGCMLRLGQEFGSYRIDRLLGKGGMGEVYAADHLESGRRVALKVLGNTLGATADRKRFLREGRLAASISHPNSVYIYGTEEIEGTPVITMELVAGGTLGERVKQSGPLKTVEAVDAMLQVISGLEAAEAVGVLHRDIKPSNCFVDAAGEVKVGDFGLSISSLARQETQLTVAGTVLGTPAFASPEQLRGDEIDLRSDIYSVGATLYYLLTGQAPFKAEGMVQMLAAVLNTAPAPPRDVRADVPKGLSKLIMRCLEKEPSKRPESYAELRGALEPFSSVAPTPATLRLRFAAGLIDMILLNTTSELIGFLFILPKASSILDNPDKFDSTKIGILGILSTMVFVLYYATSEGVWGASIGKAICRLRVVGTDRTLAGFKAASFRAALWVILPQIPFFVLMALVGFEEYFGLIVGGGGWTALALVTPAIIAILFVTARRRNGFAAVHDFASRTRVIQRSAVQRTEMAKPSEEAAAPDAEAPKIGPYALYDEAKPEPGRVVMAFDSNLRRKVWIQWIAIGSPPLDQDRCDVARLGRLRWLTGRRTEEESWDAFECPEGQPLHDLLAAPQSWADVRRWLLDLAEEVKAGLGDGTLPAQIGLDRIWIAPDRRAIILDFPAPGTKPDDTHWEIGDVAKAREVLSEVAARALEGTGPSQTNGTSNARTRRAIPLYARKFLEDLKQGRHETLESLIGDLNFLMSKTATLSRVRRSGPIVAHGTVAGFAGMLMMFSFLIITGVLSTPELKRVMFAIEELRDLNKADASEEASKSVDREALEIVVARAGVNAANPADITSAFSSVQMNVNRRRRIVEQAMAEHPNPTDEEVAAAMEALADFFASAQAEAQKSRQSENDSEPVVPVAIGLATMWGVLLFISVVSMISAVAFRRAWLLHLFGVAIVNRKGTEASRLRLLWRHILLWSPLWAGLFIGILSEQLFSLEPDGVAETFIYFVFPLSALLVGAVYSIWRPEAGPHDLLARTRLVPR